MPTKGPEEKKVQKVSPPDERIREISLLAPETTLRIPVGYGFELGKAINQEIVRRNREYLSAKGWLQTVEQLPYERPFILEDPLMIPFMENFRWQVAVKIAQEPIQEEIDRKREKEYAEFTEPPPKHIDTILTLGDAFIVAIKAQTAAKDVPKEIVDEAAKRNLPFQVHLFQGLHYAAMGDFNTADRCYEEADRALRKVEGVKVVKPEGPLNDRLMRLGFYVFYEQKIDYRKARTCYLEALRVFNLVAENHYSEGIISDSISFIDFSLGNRGIDVFRDWVARESSSINRDLSEKSESDTEEGKRLKEHYDRNKRKIMEASSKVETQGTALVLGSGGLLVTPLKDMLRDRLPDGRIKYTKIVLLDISTEASQKAVEDLVKRGEITPEEARRVEIVEADATLVLERLTKEFDKVVDPALQNNDLDSAVNGCLNILRNLSEPGELAKYAIPPKERKIKDDSVTFAISSILLQNLYSGLIFYPNGLLSIFDKWELHRGRKRLEAEFRPISRAIADLMFRDLERSLAEGGVVLFSDATQLEAGGLKKNITLGMEPYLAELVEDIQDERLYFFDDRLLPELVPSGSSFEVLDYDTWHRPIVDESQKRDFIIESMILKKGSKASYDPAQVRA